jgi:hypothetical protein
MNSSAQNIEKFIERELKALHGVLAYIGINEKRGLQFRRTNQIFHKLKNDPNFSSGDLIRQTHNFYGWKAKNEARGQCAGALYRTLGFMNIEPKSRDGSQGYSRNIHIEHTVPVSVLGSTLRASAQSLQSPRDMHRFLIQNSICVAFSHDEEQLLRTANVAAAWNEAFDAAGKRIDQHPFKRYLPLSDHMKSLGQEFQVFNVVTGEQICLETFTFSDHERTLIAASKKAIKSEDRSLYDLDIFDPKECAA